MDIKKGDKLKITGYNCGGACEHHYSCMGFIIGKVMEVTTIQPMKGPVVVRVGEAEYTIGREMLSKLEYEIIE